MSRGLGKRQRKVLAAVRTVQAEHGSDWLAPGDVLARVEAPTGDPKLDALKLTLMLHEASRRAARGDKQAVALVADLKAQDASPTWKANAFAVPKRSGNRLTPPRRRHAERINPARIFAALEARGLIERRPGVGPASQLRLTPPADPNNPNT